MKDYLHNENDTFDYLSLFSIENNDTSLNLNLLREKPIEVIQEIKSNNLSSFFQENLEKENDNSSNNNLNSLSNSLKISYAQDIEHNSHIKNDSIDKLSTNSNCLNELLLPLRAGMPNEIMIKFNKNKKHKLYRKDGYYKHFKVIFGRFLKNKVNKLKNICFPSYNKNNFSTPNYKYIGNPKEKDNYNFLSFTIKDIFIYGKEKLKQNRQYNNLLIINFIENNERKAKDKNAYKKLILFLNDKLENAFIDFYNDENEFKKINNDKDCIFFDEYFKKDTGFSLLEKNGFLKAIKRKII